MRRRPQERQDAVDAERRAKETAEAAVAALEKDVTRLKREHAAAPAQRAELRRAQAGTAAAVVASRRVALSGWGRRQRTAELGHALAAWSRAVLTLAAKGALSAAVVEAERLGYSRALRSQFTEHLGGCTYDGGHFFS